MGNLDDVQQKLLGPDYKYFKQINFALLSKVCLGFRWAGTL